MYNVIMKSVTAGSFHPAKKKEKNCPSYEFIHCIHVKSCNNYFYNAALFCINLIKQTNKQNMTKR